MASIRLIDIAKSYRSAGLLSGGRADSSPTSGSFSLSNINLSVSNGQTLVILGPSGCGKTTLLRIIAGLESPDKGKVLYDGEDMTSRPPRDRNIGMVFQDFALYPHLDNKTNILSYFFFRGRANDLDAEAQQKYRRTSELMQVDLSYLLHRKPRGLSPGEKQRVALARCVTRDPELLLLDEPFAHLDQRLRESYRVNLKRLLSEFRVTSVYVTHDQQEALLLADRIALMDAGKVVQEGAFQELYRAPVNAFVADFLNPDPLTPALNLVEGDMVARQFAGTRLGVRPEDLTVTRERDGFGVEGRVLEERALPSKTGTLVRAEVGSHDFYAYVPSLDETLPQLVWLRFDRMHVFDGLTGERLETHPF